MLSTQQLTDLLTGPLVSLGLSTTERNLYVTSLKLGPTPIASLAAHLGISRPNIYTIIRSLEKRGLANFSSQQRYSRTFMVESPEVIRSLLRRQEQMLENYNQSITREFPDLLALYQQGNNPTNIRIYQTEEDWDKMYVDLLMGVREELLYFGFVKRFAQSRISGEEQIKNERIQQGLHIKLLCFDTPFNVELQKSDKRELRETRFIPNAPLFQTAFHVIGKKVILRQHRTGLAIRIDDEHFAQMFRTIFYCYWEKESFSTSQLVT